MPPTVNRQVPPKPTVPSIPQAAAGSILSTAMDVQDLEDLYIKFVLYGKNRCGKTTLACQFPKPLLLVAIEPSPTGGAKSVKSIPGIQVIRITNKPDPKNPRAPYGSRKALMLVEELSKLNPYKTVVIDTATSYQDIILQELLGLSAVPEMLSWGMVSEEQYRDRSSKTREALRPFLDLACHVVVIAQEKDHNPPAGRANKLVRVAQLESHFAADLGGATVKWLHDSCDYIAQLYQEKETKTVATEIMIDGKLHKGQPEEVETGRIVRRLRTMYHPNFAAGFRSESPEVVPEYIQAVSPKEMYDAMMQIIQGIKSDKGKYS